MEANATVNGFSGAGFLPGGWDLTMYSYASVDMPAHLGFEPKQRIVSMGATLPRIPSLPALWRDPLRRALPDEGLIVDMRSGAYTAAWKPKRATVLGVRAFVDGKTVSHMVKATRGDVARILLASGETPEAPEDVATIVRQAGLTVELNGRNLDIIT